MTTPYIDPNLIFAENAPVQDKPAAFQNYDKGWDASRSNDGRPVIPQMNYLTQQADLKNLYIHENGAALPYKEGITYEENAVVVKDGVLQQWRGGEWVTDVVDLDGVDKIDAKLKRENVSVWDFFTEAELAAYNSQKILFDAARPLQEFFDYITANNVGCAYCDADLGVKSGLVLGGPAGSLTKHVKGHLSITAINTSITATPPIENLLILHTGVNFRWEGVLRLVGSTINSLHYDRRHVKNGLIIGSYGDISGIATHTYIDFIHVENGFKEWGIVLGNMTTGTKIGKIRGNRSGSGYDQVGYVASLTSTFYRNEDIAGSLSQRSVLAVSFLPEYDSLVSYAYINNGLYLITNKDPVNKTIEVFPHLPYGIGSGSLRYVFGGVFHTVGGDASVTSVGNINCSTSAMSVQLSALYPPVIESITSQNNFCALSIGLNISAAIDGGAIGEIYCEALNYDIIQNNRYAVSLPIINNVELNLDKCIHLGNPRAADNTITHTYKLGVTAGYNNRTLRSNLTPTASNTVTVPLFSENSDVVTITVGAINDKVVNIDASNESLNRLYGYGKRQVKFIKTNATARTVTFNPPANYTLNGQTTPLIFGLVGIAQVFDIEYVGANDIIVSQVSASLPSASVVYDPPSLAAAGTAGDSVTTTVPLSGAVVGNIVQAAFSQYNADVEISAVVSAANTVTVKFKNTGAAAVDLPSGTLTVKLI